MPPRPSNPFVTSLSAVAPLITKKLIVSTHRLENTSLALAPKSTVTSTLVNKSQNTLATTPPGKLTQLVKASLSAASIVLGVGLVASAYAASTPNDLSGYDNPHMTSANPQHTLTTQNTQLAEQLIEQAHTQHLATNPSWLRMHYYEGGNDDKVSNEDEKGYHSDIDNPDFFLSPQGKDDPTEEISAFIRALVYLDQVNNEGAATDVNIASAQNPICRFPAHTHWLKSQLNLPAERFTATCPEFEAWFHELDPQQLSVFFADEYPDRAVSAFGHMLLLIESTASLANPADIDQAYALNDDVDGNPDDAMPIFAYKAATGGYPNDITIDPYPAKLADYIQKDNRDVWTYRLDLTPAETQQIMRHVWETKDLQLPYYFTMDNCASEVLRYIDIVRPNGNLLDQFKVAVVPSEVVRLLYSEGLLVDKKFLPADDTLAQAQINNPNRQDIPDSMISANNKMRPTDIVPNNNNPINRHPLQRVTTGVGVEGDTAYLDVGLRFGFHDLLDNEAGYPQNFNMNAVSGNVRIYSDKDNRPYKYGGQNSNQLLNSNQTPNSNHVELDNFTILQGRSFNPLNTAKAGDSKLSSWGVNAEFTQVKDASKINESNHLVANVAYEKGVSYAFGAPAQGSGQLPPHICYALGMGSAQVGRGLSHGYRVGAGVNLGCHYEIGGGINNKVNGNGKSTNDGSSRARLIAELSVPYWYHGDVDSTYNNGQRVKDHYWQPILSIGAQYDIDRVQGIRLQGNYELQDRTDNREDIQLAYVRYF